jgi:hypothetical protein
MGQAKMRGTFEERKAQAIERDKENERQLWMEMEKRKADLALQTVESMEQKLEKHDWPRVP